MPMCHANSLNFFGAFAYCGAETAVYSRKSFDPEHAARTLAEGGSTFTSLVPTHYIMMLGLPDGGAGAVGLQPRHQADDLLGPGAPGHQARGDGDVPQFRPVRALRLERGRLGHHAPARTSSSPSWARSGANASARRRSGSWTRAATRCRTARPASSTRRNPYTFDRYWKLPEKTAEAFRGEYCTVGDMARRDAGRLHPPRRPQEQHDHLRRREHLPVGGRGRARRPSGGQGRGGGRPARSEMGRVRPRRRGPQGRRRGRARPSCSAGARTSSPATSAHAPARSCATRRCRAPPPARILHRVLKTQLTAEREADR